VSLIVIPFCLSICRSFRDLQPTTIDRSQPNLVSRLLYTCPRTRVSLFGSAVSHTLGARGKICKISPISNAYSCHCERDASFHMTCLSVCSHNSKTTQPNFTKFLLRMLHAYGLGSVPDVLCHCTSGFVDDVTFTRNVPKARHVCS